ncbi:MAG: hypothetical protein CL908_21400 [Deltaproteobacteria bacterium]|nr:hypothetical protein [Deltaproteobacteria bacterium]
MTERPQDEPRTDSDDSDSARPPARRGPPPNPLYHPLFLPVLLIAFSLWFGYDGFLTTDPEMLEHRTFNRIMFGIMLPICIWLVPRGIKEFREDRELAQKRQNERNAS